jgi:hypothetical protein
MSPYTSASSMFTNVNSADCGGFTGCSVLPVGCTGTYTGKARISAGLGLEAVQNEDYEYNEYLCVKCVNADGSSTQHDNWRI